MVAYEIQLQYVTWQRDFITESDHNIIFRKMLCETRSSLVEIVALRLVIIKPYHHEAVHRLHTAINRNLPKTTTTTTTNVMPLNLDYDNIF